MLDPTQFSSIDSLLERENSQDVADAIVDTLEDYAADIDHVEQLVHRYHNRPHPSLQRVLTFYLSRHATSLAGVRRELIYLLVPSVISTADASALTNAMTTVQRLAMWSLPWSDQESGPPPELVELLLAGLQATARTASAAMDLLESLAGRGILPRVAPSDRPRLVNAIRSAAEALDQKVPELVKQDIAPWPAQEPKKSDPTADRD